MKTLAGIGFPETLEEAKKWERSLTYFALHRRFLAVAVMSIEGRWKCLGLPVEGKNHDNEHTRVMVDGEEIDEQIARAIFPRFDDIPYAH